MSRLPLGAGPLSCPTSRRKRSTCARRVWVRLPQHQLCPGRLCPWWPTGGELCCLLQAEGDGGSGKPGSEAVTREKRRVPEFAPDLGCLHEIATLHIEGSPSPERLFSWVPFLRRDFTISRAPVYCMPSACCLHLSGLFSSPVVFGMPDGACPSSCFTTFSCTCAGSGQQSNSTGSPPRPGLSK